MEINLFNSFWYLTHRKVKLTWIRHVGRHVCFGLFWWVPPDWCHCRWITGNYDLLYTVTTEKVLLCGVVPLITLFVQKCVILDPVLPPTTALMLNLGLIGRRLISCHFFGEKRCVLWAIKYGKSRVTCICHQQSMHVRKSGVEWNENWWWERWVISFTLNLCMII